MTVGLYITVLRVFYREEWNQEKSNRNTWYESAYFTIILSVPVKAKTSDLTPFSAFYVRTTN
jgi:hypothetical protein